MKKMTALDRLTQVVADLKTAQRLIYTESRWLKGGYHSKQLHGVHRFCAIGALEEAVGTTYYLEGMKLTAHKRPGFAPRRLAAAAFLQQVLPPRYHREGPENSIMDFNDAISRTYSDVKKAFRMATATAQEKLDKEVCKWATRKARRLAKAAMQSPGAEELVLR